MTTPIWPNDLPQCFSTPSFNQKRADNVLRSQPSIGPAKTRRRTTANVTELAGEMQVTATQLTVLENFIADQIADGAKVFRFPHQFGGPMMLVRMAAPIEIGRVGALFSVSMSLEILP